MLRALANLSHPTFDSRALRFSGSLPSAILYHQHPKPFPATHAAMRLLRSASRGPRATAIGPGTCYQLLPTATNYHPRRHNCAEKQNTTRRIVYTVSCRPLLPLAATQARNPLSLSGARNQLAFEDWLNSASASGARPLEGRTTSV
ncbi:hypothetical protein FIBSPDRAFT_609743 [Athelia psychrophila]|uniref:Uncharacterized protein n=1 Tax=Athelia psychrophila TaxID=1759441 RepID=A0A166GJS7_9AGAM|nr:hypothetical protein FIBSPDRAFT_151552 [Fibularhizoctonia sp. CBS 109695]KZP17909.1 hypothetical protein FIBSPDRAFT_609743 [Fibularhizoctonia sp. CBS 109695]